MAVGIIIYIFKYVFYRLSLLKHWLLYYIMNLKPTSTKYVQLF